MAVPRGTPWPLRPTLRIVPIVPPGTRVLTLDSLTPYSQPEDHPLPKARNH
jgi:hypothetical protein